MVYIDSAKIPYRGKIYCHMTADTKEELHLFAQSIGLKKCWFHRGDHYDVNEAFRKIAIEKGAQLLIQREFMKVGLVAEKRRCV